LTYDNARLPEALIALGEVLGDPSITADGLDLLEWLVGTETLGDHFSFTPVGGRGPDGRKPAFDQQPLEAWAMADACHAAHRADPGNDRWTAAMAKAIGWFDGKNDTGLAVYDPATGAGFDGLEPESVNQNRGAESTIAALGSLLRDPELSSSPSGIRSR
jgi:hypothetical protein